MRPRRFDRAAKRRWTVLLEKRALGTATAAESEEFDRLQNDRRNEFPPTHDVVSANVNLSLLRPAMREIEAWLAQQGSRDAVETAIDRAKDGRKWDGASPGVRRWRQRP